MLLSLTTDYFACDACPEPYLRTIAETGFSHIHWCHHWSDDFVYSDSEIAQIGKWLDAFGLKLLDLHGSTGKEKNWASGREYERLAGVGLVRNRIDMTARLGGGVVIMHPPKEEGLDAVRRSLDALEPAARADGVRIAIENGDCDIVRTLLDEYDPDYVGFCYDSGHGNIAGDGLDRLDEFKGRLVSVHLHDNDGHCDHHWPPFKGTVDWARLASIIANSSYTKCVSLEATFHGSNFENVGDFLECCFEAAARLSVMLKAAEQMQ